MGFIGLIEEIVQKAETLSSLIGALPSMRKSIRRDFYKWFKVLTYNLSILQNNLPLIFVNAFKQYLAYSWKMIIAFTDPEAEQCTKGALYMLLKVLKCYSYHCPEPYFLQTKPNGKAPFKRNAEAQRLCHINYNSFFSKSVVENIFFGMLGQIMPLDEKRLEEDPELALEIENQIHEEYTRSELENSFTAIAMMMIEALFVKFPLECDEVLRKLLVSVISGSPEVDDVSVHNNLLRVYCHLPQIIQQIKTVQLKGIELEPVLAFLSSKINTNPVYARRYCLIIKAYHEFVTPEMLVKNTECILSLIDLWKNDSITQYQAVIAVTHILKSLQKLGTSCNSIVTKLTPILLSLLNASRTPQTTWNIMNAISRMLEHSENLSNEALSVFRAGCFSHFVQDSTELVREAMADMLTALICACPLGTPMPAIFHLSLEYLESALNDKKVLERSVWFWYFVTKEATPIQEIDSRLNALLLRHFDSFQRQINKSITANFVSVVEEYFLMGSINYEKVLSYLSFLGEEAWLAFPDQIETKQSILSLFATCYLQCIVANGPTSFPIQIKRLYTQFLLSEIVENGNKEKDFNLVFLGQVLILTNRIVLESPAAVLEAFKEILGIPDLAPFLLLWIKCMTRLTSRFALRIMTVTLFELMPIMGKQAFFQNLENMLEVVHQEIDYFIKLKTGNWTEAPKKMTLGSRKVQLSQRKENSRKFAKYDEFDVLQSYKMVLTRCLTNFGVNEIENIQAFAKPETMANLLRYLNAG